MFGRAVSVCQSITVSLCLCLPVYLCLSLCFSLSLSLNIFYGSLTLFYLLFYDCYSVREVNWSWFLFLSAWCKVYFSSVVVFWNLKLFPYQIHDLLPRVHPLCAILERDELLLICSQDRFVHPFSMVRMGLCYKALFPCHF